MEKRTFGADELVALAERAPHVIELLDAIKLIATVAVDFAYDRVRERDRADHPITYVYMGGFKPDKPDGYAGGERGEATWEANVPVELLDLIVVSPPAGFVLDGFYAGDENLFFGAWSLAADFFFGAVLNRGIRPKKIPARQQVVLRFHNASDDPTPRALHAAGKFRSEFTPDAFPNRQDRHTAPASNEGGDPDVAPREE